MTVWRTRIACWISKATNTHSQYVTLTTHYTATMVAERASMLPLLGGKKNVERTMCVLIFCTFLSETFLILRKPEPDMIQHVYRSACKVQLLLAGFN
jgi:hypothetical protein